LSFSQNVVSVAKNDTTNVTVNGGSGAYIISANSNPNAVTANVTGNTNIIAVSGTAVGTSVVTICSTGNSSICASVYVSVGPELIPIYFGQNNVSLSTTGERSIISVGGGSGTGKVISLNTNPSAVSATLNSDGTTLILIGGNTSGASSITICSATYSTN
ncbi:MAG: hypothetical protein NT091_02885, partial [Candidatus Falkowbacteria bacterium]|nr:hypothetical protein [Candidatus Falkowbacteria bacterium]